jgi:hypothetical protein
MYGQRKQGLEECKQVFEGAVACSGRGASEEELAAVVARVDAAEAAGDIGPWEQDDVPSAIIPPGREPARGEIASRRDFKALGGTELTLGNGMKVLPLGIPLAVACCAGSLHATLLAGFNAMPVEI